MGIFDQLFKSQKAGASPSNQDDAKARAANTTLLKAMEEIARLDSPDTRRALYQAMQKAWFLVPTQNPPENALSGRYVADAETRLSLPIIIDAQGKKVVPTFTDEEALAYWHGATPWFALQGAVFFQCVAKTEVDDIAVNPPSPGKPVIRPGGRITRTEFQALADGVIPSATRSDVRLQQGTKVLLGMPAQMPRPEIFSALASAASACQSIRGLYYCQLRIGEGAPHGAIAIDLLPTTPQSQVGEIIDTLGAKIQPLLANSEFFDFFPSHATGLAAPIMKNGKAIYVSAVQ
jgi:hypothetical protein